MTLITMQGGAVVMRDGKVGTEQGCCCATCSCAGLSFGDPVYVGAMSVSLVVEFAAPSSCAAAVFTLDPVTLVYDGFVLYAYIAAPGWDGWVAVWITCTAGNWQLVVVVHRNDCTFGGGSNEVTGDVYTGSQVINGVCYPASGVFVPNFLAGYGVSVTATVSVVP